MSTVKHTASFEIAQPVAVLFPLFSAEGEKLWVPGWDYENVMGYTDLHEDYVFVTKSHDHADSDAIWLVKKYEPEDCLVQLYKIEPGEKIGIVEVQCFEQAESQTKIRVTDEYIGLSEKGNEFVSKFTVQEYGEFISEWESLLLRYFEGKH